MTLYPDESARRAAFPICEQKIFLAHAAVCALPRAVADAMHGYVEQGALSHQEDAQTWRDVAATRVLGARLLSCDADEIALLGPTSIGLSLFANGLDWQLGDEVVCHADDYPSNVYPWLELERRGVTVRLLKPERPGEITPALVESVLTPRTRLVALTSAHYFSGYRPDLDTIGAMLHARGILFAVDAIQTLGAFPLDTAHVDFLSADAHKWMLGPCAIGLVMVKRQHFETLRPTLLGAWNVHSPGFIAQPEIRFVPTAQRYEPGVLNFPGIYGMKAGLELLLDAGIERIAARLLELKAALLARIEPLGFEAIGPREGSAAHAITAVRRAGADHKALHERLLEAGIVASLRPDRAGRDWLRFSPHFYNTEAEFDRVADVLR
ncbi:MAG: aminotransferase class V-fold PLP-dependent enzyme [Chthoniobacteraceae bacterium]